MQGHTIRYVLLIALLLLGAGGYALIGDGTTHQSRWPDADAVFAVDGWDVSQEHVELANGSAYVTRALQAPGKPPVTLTIVTNQNVKLFGSGAEVPFLGNGYEVMAAPPRLVPPSATHESLIAQHGNERWLVVYGYGQRRGLLGNGAPAWGMALLDSLLGETSDFYKLYLTVPLNVAQTPDATNDIGGLADVLFPQISGWYRSA